MKIIKENNKKLSPLLAILTHDLYLMLYRYLSRLQKVDLAFSYFLILIFIYFLFFFIFLFLELRVRISDDIT